MMFYPPTYLCNNIDSCDGYDSRDSSESSDSSDSNDSSDQKNHIIIAHIRVTNTFVEASSGMA